MNTSPTLRLVTVRTCAIAAAVTIAVGLSGAQPASATSQSERHEVAAQNSTPLATADADERKPTFIELDFAHPVSLQSALTVKSAAGAEIVGYHFVSDSIVGDYFPGTGLSAKEFLADVAKKTGTAPEVVKAYIDGDADQEVASRSASTVLGETLAAFNAPDADPDPQFISAGAPERRIDASQSSAMAGATWVPNDAEVMITPVGSSNIGITGKYSWWGLDPYASPGFGLDSSQFQVWDCYGGGA